MGWRQSGRCAEVGRILGTELEQEWDGSFVVTLSPEPHPGNWERERPMTVRLERIGEEGPPSRLTLQGVIDGLEAE